MHYARGKCLGGSSARNYLTYHVGAKDSYERWANQTGDDDYRLDNFMKYFKKSQNFVGPNGRPANATPEYDESTLSTGGLLTVTYPRYAMAFSSWAQRALQAIGVRPINGLTSGNLLGSSYQLLTEDATEFVRETSETAFLKKLGLTQSNLVVYQSTLATKITFNGTTASGVEIDMGGFPFTLTANKEVVLSAGAFQSPQLLMVSGIGPKDTLERFAIPVVKNLPGVGQNMEDHILGGPSYRVNVVTTSTASTGATAAEAMKQYLTSRSGILTGVGADFLGEFVGILCSSVSQTKIIQKLTFENAPSLGKAPQKPYLADAPLRAIRPGLFTRGLAGHRVFPHERLLRLPGGLPQRQPYRWLQLRHRRRRACGALLARQRLHCLGQHG